MRSLLSLILVSKMPPEILAFKVLPLKLTKNSLPIKPCASKRKISSLSQRTRRLSWLSKLRTNSFFSVSFIPEMSVMNPDIPAAAFSKSSSKFLPRILSPTSPDISSDSYFFIIPRFRDGNMVCVLSSKEPPKNNFAF